MTITAFADPRPIDPDGLRAAAVRWPRPSRLARPLRFENQRAARAAASLGLTTVGELLEHLPRDRREARTIDQLAPGEVATVVVEVLRLAARPVRRRGMRPLVEATVSDGSGTLVAAFFNQPWLVARYPPGTRLVLHGKLEARHRFRVQGHARTSPGGPADGGETGAETGEVGHYAATDGLSSTQILALVRAHAKAMSDVPEPLPALVRAAERLPDRGAALAAAHLGDGDEQALARRRLAFDELLALQLALLRRRRLRRDGAVAVALNGERPLSARWLSELLPFEPTGDQRRAIAEIDRDLALARPMQRLLMGEVGSGKTVVALYALLRAIEHGRQGAMMAPTEPLAEQHFRTLQTLLGDVSLPIALLTGSTAARRRSDVLGKLSSGELALVVGTHALIEDSVRFASLAVAVVDEQHRFGVRQRAALDAKSGGRDAAGGSEPALRPHVLHMTATPIPRTLALSHYGDLDFTVLRELPRGRRPIRTFACATTRERARAYERIREELRAGRQAFVVCPLVTESELLAARAATAEYERLRDGQLRDFRLVLMHGQLTPAAKHEAMAAFVSGAADVMVATSVIEVGIDVPNATVMLVEDADRYGISQLHQLRGRIGRGEHDSICLLFGARRSARLRALADHADGFRLAEIDLELRGEGELAGTRQSGAVHFRVAELPRDRELQERARWRAEEIEARDPALELPEHALLADLVGEVLGGM